MVIFSPDGKTLASSDDEGSIILWDVQNGVSKCTIQSDSSSVRSLSFSSDGQFLVSGGDDGYIRIWDLMRGILASSFHAHSAGISSIAFSYNNQTIISSSWDKTVKIWVVETAISKFFSLGFFGGMFGKKQTETESVSSLPSFILQQAREAKKNLAPASTSSISTSIESDAYSFRWENANIPVRDPQISLEDWHLWLKEWKRKEEERKKEQRAKERLRLREERLNLEKQRAKERLRLQEERLKLEKQREERLRKEQKLKEEKRKQEQQRQQQKLKQKTTDFWSNSSPSNSDRKTWQEKSIQTNRYKTSNFWNSTSPSSSGGKIRVQGYHRKDGTYVKPHYRKKN